MHRNASPRGLAARRQPVALVSLGTLLALAALLPAPDVPAQERAREGARDTTQDAAAVRDGFDLGFELRLRGETWDAPSGSASRDPTFTYGLARARLGLEGRWQDWTLTAVLQGATAADLPENGSFGIGPVYTAANDGDTDPTHLGVAELAVGYRGDGFGVTAGRQRSTEGYEVGIDDPYLDAVKRARVAERLLGNWDWVNVGRRYDGLSAELTTGFGPGPFESIHWTGYAFRPDGGRTRGGVLSPGDPTARHALRTSILPNSQEDPCPRT